MVLTLSFAVCSCGGAQSTGNGGAPPKQFGLVHPMFARTRGINLLDSNVIVHGLGTYNPSAFPTPWNGSTAFKPTSEGGYSFPAGTTITTGGAQPKILIYVNGTRTTITDLCHPLSAAEEQWAVALVRSPSAGATWSWIFSPAGLAPSIQPTPKQYTSATADKKFDGYVFLATGSTTDVDLYVRTAGSAGLQPSPPPPPSAKC
jgi:hypothetical protein